MALDSYYIQFAIALITLISFALLRRGKTSNLNEPPLVPYKYPIIGHTLDYYNDTENFVKKCQVEYGETFSLYVFGRIITFLGKELTPEVFRNHKDFDFGEAADEFFPFPGFLDRSNTFFDGVNKIVQMNLSGDLKSYTDRVQRQLIKSIDEIIGNGKVLKPPMKFIQLIIAKPIVAIFVGEELCDDEEFVNSFAYITSDVSPFISIPPILNFIHPSLHRKLVVALFKSFHNSFKANREILRKKVIPLIENRFSEMKKLGNAYDSPNDLLQRFIEMSLKDDTVDTDMIIDYMIGTIFASVHTTSTNLALSLQEFVNNPQCHKELLEEQAQLYKSNDKSYYTVEQIANLGKLDSFVRETFRMCSSIVALEHKMISPEFTFANGYQIPNGRIVSIRMQEIHSDEALQGQNPNEFNAFRHLEKNSAATRVEKNYLAFGLGKHACPGRHFAVNEIKFALHYLLLKYDIRKEDNGKFSPIRLGGLKVPSEEGLRFEKKRA